MRTQQFIVRTGLFVCLLCMVGLGLAQDRVTVERLLDPDVQIFESGYVERSRGEYLGHHFLEDAKFSKGMKTRILKRGGTQAGDVAVVWSETATDGSYEGKPK